MSHKINRPEPLKVCDLPGTFRIRGNYLYGIREGRLEVYDISIPTNPTLVGSLSTSFYYITLNKHENYPYLYGGKGVEIDGDNPASCCSLFVIDISEPTKPKIIGSTFGYHVAGAFDVQGGYLYMVNFLAKTNSAKGGFWVYDVSDPTNPYLIGWGPTGHPTGILVAGNYAYVAECILGYEIINGIAVYDISDPTTPTYVGGFDFWEEWLGCDGFLYCKVDNYIYVYKDVYEDIHEGETGPMVICIDVSDPANPYLVSTLRLPSVIRSACYLAPYIYFVADDSVIRVLDTHDELFYRVISESHIPDSPEAICSDDALIYTVGDKLLILKDVAIDSFSVLGECNLPLRCKDIVVRSGIAYVIADSLLFIVDVTDSHNPEVIDTQPLVEHTRELDVYANHVYITQGDSGVVIIDASAPRAPQEVGWLTGMKKVNGLTIAPPYMFVVSDSGLWQWDITQPDVPELVQHKPLKYRADEVTVGDQYVFVHYSRYPIGGYWRIAALSRDTLGLEGVIGYGYIRDMFAVDDTLYVISGGITGYAIKEVGIEEERHQTVELLNNVVTNRILLRLPDCHGQHVEITLYDLAGRMLRTLYKGYVVNNKLLLDIRDVNPGVYFVKIKLQQHSMVNKIIVVK